MKPEHLQPCACNGVIFGITGDLARRKLLGALYHLDKDQLLHADTRFLGLAHGALSLDDFRNLILNSLVQFVGGNLDQTVLRRLMQRFSYRSLEFADAQAYAALCDWFTEKPQPTLFYFATSAAVFGSICAGLAAAQLIAADSQVIMEKPIGDNLRSSQGVNDTVGSYFSERQIYRIDHYLGKETVLNLLVLRFANALFTSNWDYTCIDHVQITVAESVGIEDRWAFYDKAGQMRDMVQNHLLQILCLLAMEPPADLDAESIRSEKLKVLKALRPITRENLARNVVRGQYTEGFIKGKPVPGYHDEAGANRGSATETFVAIKAEIDNWRWSGVPFYLRTGKRLAVKHSEINIHFKAQPHNIFHDSYPVLPANKLTIRLQPDEGIELQMMNKVPGITEIGRIAKNRLDLSFSESFNTARIVDAYERLLFEAMQRNQSWFVSRDEVEQAWRWVDRILELWQENGEKPDTYPAGSWGPISSIALIARDEREWDG
ncbi:MAG: glucose-6-phosphate dehydrogenase [Pseudomonadales bacterium]|jgi:glucose-6-phosphate 1-dehydrogenase|nr:glucose-6-phosphate dehydrogenase [Pseudomonadales bacterium]